MSDDYGATVNDWLNLVRRTPLGRSVKSVVYYIAGRANADGTHIFPGIARTAVECEMSPIEVRRALAKLRKVGLIEMTKRGNRRRGQADEYRLIVHAELPDRITVPTPDEHAAAIGAVSDNAKNRERQRRFRQLHKENNAHQEASNAHQKSVTPRSDDSSITLTQESVTPSNNAHSVTGVTLTQMSGHPPSLNTLPVSDPPSPSDRSSSTTRSQRAWDDCPRCLGDGTYGQPAVRCPCKDAQRKRKRRRSAA